MPTKIFYDKIRLGFGQSLILGHRPDNLDIKTIGDNGIKKDLEIESFGLFEAATPNFHTYYPDVSAADLKPKDGDFIKPIFRALSEVIVHKKYNPIDFSMNGILKKSMNKLLAQSIYANHEALVGNEIGSVSQVSWQDSYKASNGVIVPAGINAEFKIDGKSHPNIARSIMMDPPSIHSNSVTVQFGWEKSHPSMENNDFWGKIGSYGSDGQLIRRIATDIAGYHETSLVAHGADPFAQKIGKNGEINNPEYADSVYSFSAQGKEKPSKYYFSYKDDITSLSEESTTPNESININSENQMKELIAKLAAKYKKPEAEITEEFILSILTTHEASVTELAVEKENVTRLNGELETLKKEKSTTEVNLSLEKTSVTNLTGENVKLKDFSDKQLLKAKTEAKRLYNVIKGDKADQAKLDILEKASYEDLQVSIKEYSEELEKDFPATCKQCGSNEVSRNTAQHAAAPEEGKGTSKSLGDLNEQIRKENRQGWIFEQKAK